MENTPEKSNRSSVSKFPQEHTTGRDDVDASIEVRRPHGWMYKSPKIGPYSLGWYAFPRTQLGMVAGVCFLCPGMFNALSGLGGGGRKDPTLADRMVGRSGSQSEYRN